MQLAIEQHKNTHFHSNSMVFSFDGACFCCFVLGERHFSFNENAFKSSLSIHQLGTLLHVCTGLQQHSFYTLRCCCYCKWMPILLHALSHSPQMYTLWMYCWTFHACHSIIKHIYIYILVSKYHCSTNNLRPLKFWLVTGLFCLSCMLFLSHTKHCWLIYSFYRLTILNGDVN